jgi:hypothetical protein
MLPPSRGIEHSISPSNRVLVPTKASIHKNILRKEYAAMTGAVRVPCLVLQQQQALQRAAAGGGADGHGRPLPRLRVAPAPAAAADDADAVGGKQHARRNAD